MSEANVVSLPPTTRSAADIGKELDAKIPRDAISEREGGGRKKLSYLETWYVINRMNQIFGHLNWSNETVETRLVYEGAVKNSKGEDVFTCHYTARVRIMIQLSDGRVVMKDGFGYGDGTDKLNPGKAHELAIKEAESDAFKRAAKNFGLSLGLALYAKDEDLIEQPGTVLTGARAMGNDNSAKDRVVGVSSEPQSAEPTKAVPSRDQVNQLITETAKVLNARKIQLFADTKKYIEQTFGVKTKEELTDEQAGKLLSYLKSIL